MFGFISRLWEEHGFELLVILSVCFLLIYAFTRIGKKGTFDNTVYFPTVFSDTKKISKRGQPNDSKGELICRNYLERVFNKPFNKSRPNFLRNPVTGGDFNLELDCFNPEMRLALEYNGEQHYKYIPYFHKNKEAFYNQKYRDEMKRTKCRDAGITLIEVPYDIKSDRLEGYVKNELIKFGFLR